MELCVSRPQFIPPQSYFLGEGLGTCDFHKQSLTIIQPSNTGLWVGRCGIEAYSKIPMFTFVCKDDACFIISHNFDGVVRKCTGASPGDLGC